MNGYSADEATQFIPKVVDPEPEPVTHGVHGLIHVRDGNHVSWWFNPSHVVTTVMNRESQTGTWSLTLAMSHGARIIIYDGNVEKLLARFRYGDPIGDGR